MSLYPTISQIAFWGVGDIDECSILATYWAAKAAGFEGELPSIYAFRAAAGRPDLPGPTGLTNAQALAGIGGTSLKSMSLVTANGASWDAFAASLKLGGSASLSVNSALLPSGVRYDFYGSHSVGLTWQGGKWHIANPLAPDKSAPVAISEAAIKAAALSFGGGAVVGIIFRPAQPGDVAAPAPVSPLSAPQLPAGFASIPAFQHHFNDAQLTAQFYAARSHPVV